MTHTSLTIGEEAAAALNHPVNRFIDMLATHETDNMRWLREAGARLREDTARAAIIKENE